MQEVTPIESPDGQPLEDLCRILRQRVSGSCGLSDWPRDSLRDCGKAGVFRWFLPASQGGMGWSEREQTLGYLRLAEADLTRPS